jgi:2-C-methyl-D-erythritol 4-phosphate cytidylyltransferase
MGIDTMARIAVIIPAAGKGERFGASEKKTFAKVEGRAVFLRSIEYFLQREDVCQTILAIAPDDQDEMKAKYAANLGFMGVKLVVGGEQRFQTVAKALEVVPEDAEFVAVHDAVRCCVSTEMIDAVFAEAQKTGAAILAAPLVGTIKRVSEAKVVDATVPREGLYEAQTPQVFRRSLLVEAYAKLAEFSGEPTDDSQLVEALGHPVSIVPSDFTNLKITTRGDLTLAGAIIRTRPKPKPTTMGPFQEAQW